VATLKYVQGDTAPDITFTVTRSGAPVDLTGATVQFKILNQNTNSRTNDAHNTCTISSPATAGICTYSLQLGDLPDATTYSCDLVITYSGGKEETSPSAIIIIARAEA
jgi:hypothetical protein